LLDSLLQEIKMSSEKFCLRWNDFETNISLAFRELRNEKDFFDVMLACDDEQIQAHKVILSACSPFFRNILRKHQHQNPLLYLKGVKYTDLQSVLNFMYHGEVNVAQEDLNSFLAVAEDLRVKGLTQNQSVGQNTERKNDLAQKNSPLTNPSTRPPDRQYHQTVQPPVKQQTARQSFPQSTANNRHHVVDDVQEVVPVKSEPREVSIPEQENLPPSSQSMFTPTQPQSNILAHTDDQDFAYADADGYDDYGQYADEQQYQVGNLATQPVATGVEGTEGDSFSFQDPSDLLQFVKKDSNDQKFHCSLCGKFSHKYSSCTRNHVESKHFPNMFSYPCDECPVILSSKTSFNLHRSRNHTSKNK